MISLSLRRLAFYHVLLIVVILIGSVTAMAGDDDMRLSGRIDSLYFTRTDADKKPLAGNNSVTFGSPQDDIILMDTDDLSLEWEPGFRATFDRDIGDGRQVEVSAFWLDSFSESVELVATGGSLDVPFTSTEASAMDGANQVEVDYDSAFYGLEANIYQPLFSDFVTALFGVRYLRLDEDLDLFSIDEDAVTTGEYEIHTDNQMLGLRVGLKKKISLQQNDKTSVTLGVKGGVFNNWSSQRQHVIDNNSINPNTLRTNSSDDSKGSLLGEARIEISHMLSKRVGFHAGYQVLGLSNVALAPDQSDYNTPIATFGDDVHHDDVAYHGAYIGFGVRW